MINYINKKIAIKVALFVNLILFVVICGASVFLVMRQNAQLEEQLRNKGISQSIIGAKTVGQIMEEAIDNGVFSINDAFDKDYQLILNFDPPKYHTKYDSYLDKAILGIQDEYLLDESLIYAASVDINGYAPTHNSRFQKAPTGDLEKDKSENRTKRIFNDPIGITAAKNEVKGFQQIYHRDTGEILWDFSSPIYVKGKHWGNFRVGISPASIKNAKLNLAFGLILIMVIIFAASIIATVFYINRSLIPLNQLTKFAGDLANGDIDQKVTLNRVDELGQLSLALERLHYSLKLAKSNSTKK